jgi:hypothetical protein
VEDTAERLPVIVGRRAVSDGGHGKEDGKDARSLFLALGTVFPVVVVRALDCFGGPLVHPETGGTPQLQTG